MYLIHLSYFILFYPCNSKTGTVIVILKIWSSNNFFKIPEVVCVKVKIQFQVYLILGTHNLSTTSLCLFILPGTVERVVSSYTTFLAFTTYMSNISVITLVSDESESKYQQGKSPIYLQSLKTQRYNSNFEHVNLSPIIFFEMMLKKVLISSVFFTHIKYIS